MTYLLWRCFFPHSRKQYGTLVGENGNLSEHRVISVGTYVRSRRGGGGGGGMGNVHKVTSCLVLFCCRCFFFGSSCCLACYKIQGQDQ